MKTNITNVLALAAAAGLCFTLSACDDGFEKANQPAGATPAAATDHDHADHDHADHDHDHADHDHADHDHADEADAGPEQDASGDAAAKPSGGLPVNIGGAVFTAGGAMMVFPPTWEMVPVTSSLTTAKRQYNIPGEAGPGNATVYVGSMGPAQANIDRWVAQIANPDEEVHRMEHIGPVFKVVEVIGHGDVPTTMGGAPQEDHTLMALLITGGFEGDMYVKAVGPRATMEQYREDWQTLIDSIIRSGR